MSRRLWVTGGGRQVSMYYRWARGNLGAPRAAARLMTAGYMMGVKAERDRINRGANPGSATIRTYGTPEAWRP